MLYSLLFRLCLNNLHISNTVVSLFSRCFLFSLLHFVNSALLFIFKICYIPGFALIEDNSEVLLITLDDYDLGSTWVSSWATQACSTVRYRTDFFWLTMTHKTSHRSSFWLYYNSHSFHVILRGMMGFNVVSTYWSTVADMCMCRICSCTIKATWELLSFIRNQQNTSCKFWSCKKKCAFALKQLRMYSLKWMFRCYYTAAQSCVSK